MNITLFFNRILVHLPAPYFKYGSRDYVQIYSTRVVVEKWQVQTYLALPLSVRPARRIL